MHAGLARLIETTLQFRYYRGGNYHTIISDQPHSMPQMVVGQIVGNGLKSYTDLHGDYIVNDGDGYCTPAGTLKRSVHLKNDAAMFHWAHVDFFVFNGVDLARLVDFPPVFSNNKGKQIGKINRRLLQIWEQEHLSLPDIIERKRLGMQLLEVLIDNTETIINAERLRLLERMQPILEHMHDHIADPLQAQNLAALFDLSFSRFYELFTEATGISPGQYQLQLRLKHAQTQLVSTDHPIKDIAESIGYADNHYFSRIFKKTFGMTPGNYRKYGGTAVT